MDIIFLGTSGATPTKERNLPSWVLRMNNGELLIFDAGEDIQRRFEAAKLKFNTKTTIFISHLHGDHIIGLPGLLFNFHLNDRTAPLTIIGPRGIEAYLSFQYQIIGLKAQNYPLQVIEILPGDEGGKMQIGRFKKYQNVLSTKFSDTDSETLGEFTENYIFQQPRYSVRAVWVDHSIPTLAFRVEESPYDGKFNPARAKELNIPQGYVWKKLQQGKEVVLKDGRTIHPEKMGVVSEKRPGYIIAYSGDTAICPSLEQIARDADYFICESTYGSDKTDLALEKKHLTAVMAAELAKQCDVKHLILTHFSSRYKDLDVLLNEAVAIFENTQVALDLLRIEIKPRQYPEKLNSLLDKGKGKKE